MHSSPFSLHSPRRNPLRPGPRFRLKWKGTQRFHGAASVRTGFKLHGQLRTLPSATVLIAATLLAVAAPALENRVVAQQNRSENDRGGRGGREGRRGDRPGGNRDRGNGDDNRPAESRRGHHGAGSHSRLDDRLRHGLRSRADPQERPPTRSKKNDKDGNGILEGDELKDLRMSRARRHRRRRQDHPQRTGRLLHAEVRNRGHRVTVHFVAASGRNPPPRPTTPRSERSSTRRASRTASRRPRSGSTLGDSPRKTPTATARSR